MNKNFRNATSLILISLTCTAKAESFFESSYITLGFGDLIEQEQNMAEQKLYYHLGLNTEIISYLNMGADYTYTNVNDKFAHRGSFYLEPNYKFDDVMLYARLKADSQFNEVNFGGSVGMVFNITPKLGIDLNYGYTSIEERDLFNIGIGLRYRFHHNATPVLNKRAKILVGSKASILVESKASILVESKPIVALKKISVSGCSYVYDSLESVSQTVEYTIKKNDWLLKIARNNCVTLETLAELNKWLKPIIAEDKYISPQQKIRVPALNLEPLKVD